MVAADLQRMDTDVYVYMGILVVIVKNRPGVTVFARTVAHASKQVWEIGVYVKLGIMEGDVKKLIVLTIDIVTIEENAYSDDLDGIVNVIKDSVVLTVKQGPVVRGLLVITVVPVYQRRTDLGVGVHIGTLESFVKKLIVLTIDIVGMEEDA